MSEYLLAHLWYFVVGFALIAYVVLDGFDLGVGMLHVFTKKDEERRIFLNSIGPVWDGNEVWLVIVGGALFAGFPGVYATLFSAFYDLAMVFVASLVFRAVAIEFRSKKSSPVWRSIWDYIFSIASFGIAFGAGIVLGNLIEGIPLDKNHDFIWGPLSVFFKPYSVLIGFLAVSLFLMHGTIFLVMKTEGELHDRIRGWSYRCMIMFFILYAVATVSTIVYQPYMIVRMKEMPWVSSLAFVALFLFLSIPKLFSKGRDGTAFIFSCLGIAALIGLFGIGTYPVLARSSLDPEHGSLTVLNSAASILTLRVCLIIAVIGVPMVIGYGIYIYKVFKGKVKIGPSSY